MKKGLLIKSCDHCPFYVPNSELENNIIRNTNLQGDALHTTVSQSYVDKCLFYDLIIKKTDDIVVNLKPNWCKLKEIEGNDYEERAAMDCRICGESKKDVENLPIYAWGSEGVCACLDCRKLMGEFIRLLRGFIMDANKRAYKKYKKRSEQ